MLEILNRVKSGTRTPDDRQRAACFGNLKKVQMSLERWELDENGYWYDSTCETIKFENIEEALDYIKRYKGHIRNLHIYAL